MMEYSTSQHLHHTGGNPVEVETKSTFLHDPSPCHQQIRSQTLHQPNFHHPNHHRPPLSQEQSPMDVKLMDTSSSSGSTGGGSNPDGRASTSRLHGGGYHPSAYENSGQSLEQSPYLKDSPPSPALPGSSPSESGGTISAAAEYLRHQELSRGQPRKRVYQDWNQVAIFNTPSEAEEGIKNFETCRWKVGNKFTSREGFKVYWSCREGGSCPVQIHLLYHSQLPRVILFRNQPAHHHTEKVKTRGLLPEVERLIRELFQNGVNKPRRIQFILQKKGMEEVPQTKLSNFLVKLRREAAIQGNGSGGGTRSRGSRDSSFHPDFDDDDEGVDGAGSYSQDDKSRIDLSPSAMFPSVILTTPSDPHHHQPHPVGGMVGSGGAGTAISAYPPHHHPHHHHHHHHHQMGSSTSAGYMNSSSTSSAGIPPHQFSGGVPRYPSPYPPQQHLNGTDPGEPSIYSPNNRHTPSVYSGRSSTSVAAASKDEEADQSEVVTCSSSRTRSFYCRDETTEDGDHCLPDEANIKDLVISHIRKSYSNRDMLHIRQELRTLKHENKFTALTRLLSFTAGFLQDSFLEKHDNEESPAGTEGDN